MLDTSELRLGVSLTAQRRAHSSPFRPTLSGPTFARKPQDYWDITCIEISYQHLGVTRRWIPIRWDAADQVLSSFEHLERVTVVFKKCVEGCQAYADKTVAMMPLLTQSNKLRLRWTET